MPSRTQSDALNTAADHIMPVIRVYDEPGDVIETHEHKGDFKEFQSYTNREIVRVRFII